MDWTLLLVSVVAIVIGLLFLKREG